MIPICLAYGQASLAYKWKGVFLSICLVCFLFMCVFRVCFLQLHMLNMFEIYSMAFVLMMYNYIIQNVAGVGRHRVDDLLSYNKVTEAASRFRLVRKLKDWTTEPKPLNVRQLRNGCF